MKIVFVSNFMNHHQLSLCKELIKKTEDNFTFIATTPVPQERLSMGYHDMNKNHSFVCCAYESNEKLSEALDLVENSDVLIVGDSNIDVLTQYIRNRKKENKLTFHYMERIYKKGISRILSPGGLSYIQKNHSKYIRKKTYMLCASAYTAWDFSLTGNYINKTLKWGYFPEVHRYNIDELMLIKTTNVKTKILWVARLIDWKHPEIAVKLAEKLKKEGYEFELDIIGNGILEKNIENMIQEKDLSGCVYMLGSMSPEEVRTHMEKANIFLFTSDFNEGWGAVLNESMNSACAVVANYAIGSVPFLINHGINGYIYKNGDIESIYRNVKLLIDNPQHCKEIGRNAYLTMIEEWSPEIAAERFVVLSEKLLADPKVDIKNMYSSGPCSFADRIGNLNMYKYCTKK